MAKQQTCENCKDPDSWMDDVKLIQRRHGVQPQRFGIPELWCFFCRKSRAGSWRYARMAKEAGKE